MVPLSMESAIQIRRSTVEGALLEMNLCMIFTIAHMRLQQGINSPTALLATSLDVLPSSNQNLLSSLSDTVSFKLTAVPNASETG